MPCLKSREKSRVTHLDALGLIILKGKLMTTYQFMAPIYVYVLGKNKLGNNILLSSANQSVSE